MNEILHTILIWAVPVLFAITLHEAAHGWVANKLGDPTARLQGRISANPFKHIDPMGTIVIPIMMLLTFGFAIGAAKPVPIDPRNFRQPYLDMALVALAGPVSNFLMATASAGLIWTGMNLFAGSTTGVLMFQVGQAGVAINLLLLALNLLPIPPLDGSKVVAGVMPPRMAARYLSNEKLGFIILIALIVLEIALSVHIFSTLLSILVSPFMLFFESMFNFKGSYF